MKNGGNEGEVGQVRCDVAEHGHTFGELEAVGERERMGDGQMQGLRNQLAGIERGFQYADVVDYLVSRRRGTDRKSPSACRE